MSPKLWAYMIVSSLAFGTVGHYVALWHDNNRVGMEERGMQESSSGWWNFETNRHDYMQGTPPPQDHKKYIPQIPSALGLYDTYLAMGKTPERALIETLESVLGAKP